MGVMTMRESSGVLGDENVGLQDGTSEVKAADEIVDVSDASSSLEALQCTFELDDDTLATIFMYLDAFVLARMGTVCKAWRGVAMADDLWGRAAQLRWGLHRKSGRYKYGERSWREVYRVFHRRMRIPTCPGVGPRDVVYASGRKAQIYCWLVLNHQPACRLAERTYREVHLPGSPQATCRVLSCRLVVQNLRDVPIEVDPIAGLALTLRDGTVSRPLAAVQKRTADSSSSPTGDVSPDSPLTPARRAPLRLKKMEVGVVSEVSFPALGSMRFEPDFLEAAHSLRLRASGVGHCGVYEVLCSFLDESQIWEHYEEITRDFYVHVDSRDE